MTALEIIETTLPLISGSTVSKEPAPYTTMLRYLNFAKSKVARDCNLWVGGEQIVMTTENIYTLTTMPLIITEVYDENLNIRPRNKFDTLGYTQIAPNKIYVNNPTEGMKINLNWFEDPTDFLIDDEVYIPSDLVEAMQHYMAYKVFSIYKGQEEELKVKIHLDMYNKIVTEYKFNTDMQNIDSINSTDMIFNKGLV